MVNEQREKTRSAVQAVTKAIYALPAFKQAMAGGVLDEVDEALKAINDEFQQIRDELQQLQTRAGAVPPVVS